MNIVKIFQSCLTLCDPMLLTDPILLSKPENSIRFSLTILFLYHTRDVQWRRQWHPTPVLLPGKSHGWRSLVGCSPWGHKDSDTTERLHFHFSLLCIGEGNDNPLQCSCLENPRDVGAWLAAVYGVAQSRIQLKWLTSKLQIHIHCMCWSCNSVSLAQNKHKIQKLTYPKPHLKVKMVWCAVNSLSYLK